MTDEDRLARLTELARRVLPEQLGLEVVDGQPGDALPWCALAWDDSASETAPLLVFECHHPRALDALEAALLAMLGEQP